MESAESVAAKRRVLVEALMMCLEKSRVCRVVDGKTIRGVLDSASGELWRQNEFRLDPVWKLLVTQPGLTAEDVAPPLLVFKAYEKELGVAVRVPQALSAIPPSDQVRLRDALGIQRQDFERTLTQMRALSGADGSAPARAARSAESPTAAAPAKSTQAARSDRRALAFVLVVLAVAALAIGSWLALRDTSSVFDLGDVAATLQLGNGRAAGGSLTATITDTRWDTLPPDERRKLASQVMDVEAGKGIHVMTLIDLAGATRAIVSDGPSGRNVVLP
jgi:hypothetical protein